MSPEGGNPPAVRSRLVDIGGLAGVLGILVPALGLYFAPIWEFPGTQASGSEIIAFVRDHQAALKVTMVVYTLGVMLWMVFGAALWVRLGSVAGATSVLPALVAMGFASFGTLLLAGFTAFDVLVYRPTGANEAHLLYDLTFGLLAMSGLPTAVALGAYAVLEHRVPTLGTTSKWLAVAAAISHVVLLASFIVPRGFFALEGQVIAVIPGFLWIWILVGGIAMLRHPHPTRGVNPARGRDTGW
jgi:hypothetical protein